MTFIDVADNHWAKSSVYDLVKMGVTQGYPDGTFRGDQSITRYETAMFLSKMSVYLAAASENAAVEHQKDFEENYAPKLRAELDEIKKEIEIAKAPEIPRPEFGFICARLKTGNITDIGSLSSTMESPIGPKLDGRLKMTFKGMVTGSVYGEANFDTMDALWAGSDQRMLATDLIDVLGRVKTPAGFDIFFSAGPGPKVHKEKLGGVFISDNGIAFLRPRNSFGAEGNNYNVDWHAAYSALNITPSGDATVSNYNLRLGRTFDEDSSPLGLSSVAAALDCNATHSITNEGIVKESLYITFMPRWGFELSLAGGVSSVPWEDQGYFYDAALKFKDILRKGIVMETRAVRIGSQYINYPNYLAEETILGTDYFDKVLDIPGDKARNISGGGANVGLKITDDVSDFLRLTAKGTVVVDNELSYGEDRPGTYTEFEIGLDIISYTFSTFGFIYRVHHEPSLAFDTSDMVALTAKYEF